MVTPTGPGATASTNPTTTPKNNDTIIESSVCEGRFTAAYLQRNAALKNELWKKLHTFCSANIQKGFFLTKSNYLFFEIVLKFWSKIDISVGFYTFFLVQRKKLVKLGVQDCFFYYTTRRFGHEKSGSFCTFDG
jgi:hypothetical protein